MGLFICEKCFCVENTSSGRFWTKDMEDMWDDDNAGQALCSDCMPTHFKSGEINSKKNRGKQQAERSFPTKEEIKAGISYAGMDEPYHYLNRDIVLELMELPLT